MLYDVLVATRLGVILLQTFLRFLRKKALKNIETSEKLLRIKEPEVYLGTRSGSLPIVIFRIPIEKKAYLKLEPQRLLIELTCDDIPLKTFFWYKDCNIDDVVALDLEAIGDGYIEIKYPCVNVFYKHMHKWWLKGEVTFHSKIGDFSRKINLISYLDPKSEKKLREDIIEFQKKMQED